MSTAITPSGNIEPDSNVLPNVVSVPTCRSISDMVSDAISHCNNNDINDPVEILRYMQSVLVTGRTLDVEDVSQYDDGPTNFIMIDRSNVLNTAFEEIAHIGDPRLTLEVQFFGEVAVDHGGPRKEFFQLVLNEIKEKYFDNGLREHIAADYTNVGKLMCLSMLQNGRMPRFLDEQLEENIFSTEPSDSACIRNLRSGLDYLGMYTVGIKLPIFRYLLRPTTVTLTVKSLNHLLRPQFSEVGSNRRRFENDVYTAFNRYVREVASGRRGTLTLQHILQFTTGAMEEPVLGFCLHPSLEFVIDQNTFIPTANTCINSMKLPRPTENMALPSDIKLFELYDYAFSNTFYGLY